MGTRRALLIGIDNYPGTNKLNGCVADVKAIRSAIEFNGDGSQNFEVEELLDVVSSRQAMGQIETLFATDLDVALLYFSGHGYVNSTGSEIVFPNDITNDGYYNGLQMRSVMDIVNQSKAKNKIIILDCCHAGDIGKYRVDIDSSDLRTGVSILSACRGDQTAAGRDGATSYFTAALCLALSGAAADFLGNITMGNVYAYIDRFFTASEQRPVFKTNVTEFVPLKTVTPKVATDLIKEIPSLFPNVGDVLPLDPSFEFTNSAANRPNLVVPYAKQENVDIMKKLQELESIGFVEPIGEKHMYFAAMHSKACKLTDLGMYYWLLVKRGRV